LARQWINARTGQPYSQKHVSFVAQVFVEKFTSQPRPRFRDAYNAVANPAKVAHVRLVRAVWDKGAEFTPRPRFRDA
jgi:hypothetical protein